MKYVYFILALMFFLFAAVQYNDPDPLLWILIYGTMAITCIVAAIRKVDVRWLYGLMVVLALYGLNFLGGVSIWLKQDDKSALFDEIQKMEHVYIEESREFLGLMICLAVLLIIVVNFKTSKKSV